MAGETRSHDPLASDEFTTPSERFTINVPAGVSVAVAAAPLPAPSLPHIPGYVIESEIARGGMGRVLAGRELALDREVAIKVLLPRANPQRFLTESKVTAQLPHPNIPPVYALGTYDDGAPFLAMKFIHGRTLTELLKDREHNAIADLIDVFEQVAQAVGFAHSRGFIHRDLKPANIMVGEFGEVQVMDWGLARSMRIVELAPAPANGTPLDSAELTHAGAILGTPAYMAPEQARGEPVDARADVFALGSILTTILTGQPVFFGTSVAETLWEAAAGNTASALARLDACGADAELTAVAKLCLITERGKRPDDARVIAAHVRKYRLGVEQRLRQAETDRVAAEARAIEHGKQRRVVQIASAAVATVLVVGMAGTTVGLIRATWAAEAEHAAKLEADEQTEKALAAAAAETRAKLDAEDQKTRALVAAEAEKQAKLEAEAAATAERQARLAATNQKAKAEEAAASEKAANDQTKRTQGIILEIVKDLNILKIKEDPSQPVEKYLAKRLITAGRQLSENARVGNPVEVAQLQYELGVALLGLGFARDAIPLFREAGAIWEAQLGAAHEKALACARDLGNAHRDAGQLDVAVPLLEKTLARCKEALGARHPLTVSSLSSLAAGYKAAGEYDRELLHFDEAYRLARAVLKPDDPDALAAINNLAGAYTDTRQYRRALPLYEEAFKLTEHKYGDDHFATYVAMNNLAAGYRDAGQFDPALQWFAKALGPMAKKIGADHPATLDTMNNYALAYQAAGDHKKALPLFEDALRLRTARLQASHPSTLKSTCNLALCLQKDGQHERALALFEQADKLYRETPGLGPDHPSTLTNSSNLAAAYQLTGQLDRALPIYEDSLARKRTKFGADHPETLASMNNLAMAYREAGRRDRAVSMFEECVKLIEANPALGPSHAYAFSCRDNLARAYLEAGHPDRAVEVHKDLVERHRKSFGPDDPKTLGSMLKLGLTYIDARRRNEAVASFDEYFALLRKRGPASSMDSAVQLAAVSQYFLDAKLFADAEPYLKQSLAIREAAAPRAWATFNVKSLLGGAYLGQKKYALAEPLLRDGYAGLKAAEKALPPGAQRYLPDAVERLVALGAALDKPAEVAQWRAERAKYPPEAAPKPRASK